MLFSLYWWQSLRLLLVTNTSVTSTSTSIPATTMHVSPRQMSVCYVRTLRSLVSTCEARHLENVVKVLTAIERILLFPVVGQTPSDVTLVVRQQVNKAAFPHVERADVVLAEHVT